MNDSSVLEDIQFVRSQPLASLVQKEIERQILSGEFAAGARLNELDIARKLGISRAPVRESLRTLEEVGLVVIKKNYGVFVRVISFEEVREIYDARALIDGGVGELLAHLITPQGLADLRSLLAEMETAVNAGDPAGYHTLNMSFHERIVELTGNRKLLKIYRRLLKELTLFRRHSLTLPGAMARSIEEHRAIVSALGSGDAQAAGKLMRDHIVASGERLSSLQRSQPR